VLCVTAMRLPLLASLALLVPVIAHARPITAGAGVGRLEAESDSDGEADSTVQLFGRLGLTSRIAGQLEIQKIEAGSSTVRTGTALVAVEMGQSGHLVPLVLAGVGIDHANDDWGYSQEGTHIEGGFGLEYRFDGGLSLTADIRLGSRSVDDEEIMTFGSGGDDLGYFAPLMTEGEYRSARIGLAIRL
jgi:hypothetical protein